MSYEDQTKRICSKLQVAKETDSNLKVFGASSHRYFLGKPVNEERIKKFEGELQISLPDCYKAFLTQVGNGGCSVYDSGADPYYGIYPFGETMHDSLIEPSKEYLKQPALIFPNMTEDYWSNLKNQIDREDETPDDEWNPEVNKLYSGILPVGSQGCTYYHGIVLNGLNKGSVVNLDLDRSLPNFAESSNFLDWYEKWLDEIISGKLLTDKPSWFGYSGNSAD